MIILEKLKSTYIFVSRFSPYSWLRQCSSLSRQIFAFPHHRRERVPAPLHVRRVISEQYPLLETVLQNPDKPGTGQNFSRAMRGNINKILSDNIENECLSLPSQTNLTPFALD